MPLLLSIDDDVDIELSVWKNEESDSYFKRKLVFQEDESAIVAALKKRKKSEWLSSRYLLHLMSGRTVRGTFAKDIHGKPHLVDSDYHISISHTGSHVAAIASLKSVGIDIQTYVEKIARIRHKFVSEEEALMIPKAKELEALHIIWGAKESLYKAYGKRGLDFIRHIYISELIMDDKEGWFRGRVLKDDFDKSFDIKYYLFSNFVLVYAKES